MTHVIRRRHFRALLTVACLVVLAVVPNVAAALAPARQSPTTYAAFMQLPHEERQASFAALSPTEKASLKREHARRWLEANRDRLSTRQTATVEQAIVWLTPSLYAEAPSPSDRVQEGEVQRSLECAIGRDGVTAAFTFLPTPEKQSWSAWADEWAFWLKTCLVHTNSSVPIP